MSLAVFLQKQKNLLFDEPENPLFSFNKINILVEEQIPGLKMTKVGLIHGILAKTFRIMEIDGLCRRDVRGSSE